MKKVDKKDNAISMSFGFAGDNPTNVDITSELEIHKTESKAKPKPSSMQEFLDSFSKKSTRRMYKRGIELFCEWYGKDVETILKERKDDLTPRANETLVDAKQKASRYEKLLERFHARFNATLQILQHEHNVENWFSSFSNSRNN